MTETDYLTIRSAIKGARGLALDSEETDLDDELGRALDLLDANWSCQGILAGPDDDDVVINYSFLNAE